MRLKKGDYVARKSYGKDIIFIIDRIVQLKDNKSYAVLKGVTIRIEADAPLKDIEKIDAKEIKKYEQILEKILRKRINNRHEEYRNYIVKTGKILHLDGDNNIVEKL